MSTKKIAESINVRINVGNYQHIDITKYAEKEIEYSSKEEMIQKEDELTNELIANLIRNMRTIPEKLGKKTNAVVEVEESITKTIPDWLKNGEVPNIANGAKKNHNQVVSEQKELKDSQSDLLKEITEEAPVAKAKVEKNKASEDSLLFDDDLFKDEDMSSKDIFE